MTGSSISSPDYDAIRAAHPELAVNLYGMTPGGVVTLEIITPQGETFSWAGTTAASAIAQAFGSPAPAAPPADIFD